MKLTMEIKPGEGGNDAKLLIGNMYLIYQKFCEKQNIMFDVVYESKSKFG